MFTLQAVVIFFLRSHNITLYALAANLLLLLLYISVPKYFRILYTLYIADIFLIFLLGKCHRANLQFFFFNMLFHNFIFHILNKILLCYMQ